MASQWEDLGKALQTNTPVLSSILLGDRADIADRAANLLASLLAIDVSQLTERVKQIDATPQALLVEELLTASLNDDPAVLTARAQARQLSALNKDYLKKTSSLAWIVVIGFFLIAIVVGVMAAIKPDAITSNGPLGLLLGAIISAFTAVIQYYFGSSAGSAQKSAMIGKPS